MGIPPEWSQIIPESTSALVLVTDAQGVLTYVNPAGESMLGYASGELIGEHLRVLLPPDKGPTMEDFVRDLTRVQAPTTVESSLLRKDGSHCWLGLSYSRLQDSPETLTGTVAIGVNLSDRRHFEEELRKSERSLAKAQRLAHVGSWEWDLQTDEVRWSDEVYRIFGTTPQEYASTYEAFLEAVHPDDRDSVDNAVRLALKSGTAYEEDHRIMRPDGTVRWVHEHGQVMLDEGGQPVRMVGVLQDRTERVEFEHQQQLAAGAFETSSDAIVITDENACIVSVNDAFTTITQYQRDEVLGKNPRILKSNRHKAAFYIEMWEALLGPGRWHGEIWNRRQNGEVFPAWQNITRIVDEKRRTIHYVATFSDVTNLKIAEKRLQYLAQHDVLTGLPNRILFKDRLLQALKQVQESSTTGALMFIDLDGFKAINDRFGHAPGDDVLVEVAMRLQNAMRLTDTVARLGGDEFAAVCPNTQGVSEIRRIATRIVQEINAPFTIQGQELILTASVGIMVFPLDDVHEDVLLRNADAAMYYVKRHGKNDYHFFSEEIEGKERARHDMEVRLRRALAQDEFVLYYQPQVDPNTHHMLGVEALIRWHDPNRGLVMPDEFIPLAEETGLISAVDAWVIEAACRDIATWTQAGLPPIKVAVNISAELFRRRRVVSTVRNAIAETHIDPGVLELELTERMAMGDAESTIACMNALIKMGIRLSVDDFGTGYSSLSYLLRFPLHTLKIDRSFVQGNDESARGIARAIISLAHDLDLCVVGEGVDTTEHLAFLAGERCDLVQGFLFSPGVPEKELQGLFNRPLPLRNTGERDPE